LLLQLQALSSGDDAMVVGSGCGGSVAACRWARAGLRVCVMELSREFRAGDFPATPRAMIDAVRIEWCRLTLGDEDALVTFRTGRELHVITARCVGGGSLVNSAVALRPDLNAFARRRWPPGLVEDGELDYDFARVERMPGVVTPADATQHARFALLVRGKSGRTSRRSADRHQLCAGRWFSGILRRNRHRCTL
jgi:cholesterol oxidase